MYERADKRDCNQLRPMATEQALLNKCDGSCRYSQGDTAVIVGVYGPVEVKPSKEIIDKATVEVLFKPKTGRPGVADKLLEHLIRLTVEPMVLRAMHPRTSISINIQVVNDAGSLMAVAINAACMALLDAGVPLSGTFASVSCAVEPDGNLLLDPTADEEKVANSVFTLAFDGTSDDVLTSHTSGSFTTDEFDVAVDAGRKAADKALAFLRVSNQRKYARS